MEEEFNVEALIKWASRYPEFKENFIETFDNKESLEVFLKLTINVNDYIETGYEYDEGYFERFNYETIIRDLGIQFKIYKNEEEFECDYYDEEYISKDFFDFYKRLEKHYTEFYEKLKEKGITNKQIYDDAFIKPSGKYGINYNFVKLAKKYDLYEYFYDKYIKKWYCKLQVFSLNYNC